MSIKRALIVDDSRSARLMLQRLLNKINVKVESVDSAEAAFAFLSRSQPDVIFMDHMMPGMSGLEAAQAIKSNPKTATIPTIMYTSKEDDDYYAIARSHGAQGVLGKPADQEAVMAVINALDEPAANDESKPALPAPEPLDLQEVDKLIQKRLRLAMAEAKAEITAGLDSSTQQLQAMQTHSLDVIQGNIHSQLNAVKDELEREEDPQVLFKKIQPLNQQLVSKVVQHHTQSLTQAQEKQLTDFKSQLKSDMDIQNNELLSEIQSSQQQAMIQGAIIGGVLGSTVALILFFVL